MNPNTNDRPESSSPDTNSQPEIVYYQEEPILPQKEPKTRSLTPKKLLIAGAITLTALVGGWFASLKLLTFLADGGICFGVDKMICYKAAIFLNPFDGYLYRHVAFRRMLDIPSAMLIGKENDVFRESMEYYNQAIRLHRSESTYLYRAYIYQERADLIKEYNWNHVYLRGEEFTRQAIADYDEAIRRGSNADYDQGFRDRDFLWRPEIHINRGRLKVSLGDKQGALSNYREISDLYKQRGLISEYNKVQEEIKNLGG